MSAEILRKAAAFMRERAEAAINEWGVETWRVHICEFNDPEHRDDYKRNPDWMKNHVATNDVHGSVLMTSPWQDAGAVSHAASWHPAVALAVADWLEYTARGIEVAEQYGGYVPHADDHAIAVARAYLGSDA